MAAATRTTPVAVWILAGMASLLAGASLAEAPVAVVVALATPAVGAVLFAVCREPRWGLIGTLVLLYSYAGWVLGHRVGAPDLTVAVLPLLVLVLVVRRLVTGEQVYVRREVGALLAVGLAWAVSAAFAFDPGRSAWRIADFAGWALLTVLMVSLLDSVRWYRRAVWGIVAAAGMLAVLTVFQALTGSYGNTFFGFANVEGLEEGGVARSAGPLEPNNFAQILLVAGALAWYLGLSAGSRAARLIALAAAVACLGAILYTGSRGGAIALAAIFVMVVALRPVSRWALLGGAAAAAAVAFVVAPASYGDRLTSITSVVGSGVESTGDSALRGRFSENLAALRMFADHPLVGVGVANFPVRYLDYSQEIGLDTRVEERAPHSLYLEALAETGVLGAAALFYLLWLAVRGPWRARKTLLGRERLLAEGAFVAVFGYLVAALFLHGAYPRYVWIVVGLGLAAGRLTDARAPVPAGESVRAALRPRAAIPGGRAQG